MNIFMAYGQGQTPGLVSGNWPSGSKDTLDATNYAAARAAMMGFKGEEGRPLGIKPDALVVGPALESEALALIQNEPIINGGVSTSNQWSGTAKLIVSPWLA
jgi:phage major head subunit gpT-like protein